MLPAHLQELLTAAVDGELSGAERRLVEKLLRDSQEARVFHGQLSAHAERIRKLPPPPLGDDLAAGIMNIIADRAMMPTPLPMPRRQQSFNPHKLLPWISIATAACVVLIVSVSSYFFMASNQRQVAKQQDAVDNVLPAPPVLGKENNRIDPSVAKVVDRPELKPNAKTVDPQLIAKDSPKVIEPEQLPLPRVVGLDNVIATPSLPENEPFKIVNASLPWIFLPLHDMSEAYPKKATRDELKKSEVVRIDLFCKEGYRAAEVVQAAMKSRGHQVLVDALAQDRLKKKLKGDLVLYTESLSAEEIAQLLEQLGADDLKVERKKAGDGQFDKFMLAPFHPSDLNELTRLLGIPATQIKLPKPKVNGPIDPRKALETITAGQLAQNLPKSSARGNEKMSLLLPYGMTNHFPQNSKEIKSFLEKRGERKPGAVPMMLVLRTID